MSRSYGSVTACHWRWLWLVALCGRPRVRATVHERAECRYKPCACSLFLRLLLTHPICDLFRRTSVGLFSPLCHSAATEWHKFLFKALSALEALDVTDSVEAQARTRFKELWLCLVDARIPRATLHALWTHGAGLDRTPCLSVFLSVCARCCYCYRSFVRRYRPVS